MLDKGLSLIIEKLNPVLVYVFGSFARGELREDSDIDLAEKLANESKKLFDQDEILGEDFHSMLLAIQNLIEYLNKNYIEDENLEEEVNIMTKSLYDPEVEKKGIEKGIEQQQSEIVLNMLGEGLDEATISKFTKIDIEKVKEIIKKHLN